MNRKKMPRILLAGANSGCGKTSITCGILRALKNRGLNVQSHKCGPDYIDPMLHSHITGRPCRNLDPFFSTGDELRALMAKDSAGADISVTEGVMGYYDGVGISSEKSTHTVSVETGTPVVLILNVKGMAHTMIAILSGLLSYRENPVRAVILNRCSKGMFELMKPEIEEKLGIKACGYFPVEKGIEIPSRHLGLLTAEEIGDLDAILDRLGKMAEDYIDLDLLLRIADEAEPLPERKLSQTEEVKTENAGHPVRIGLAWDKAFCFYYQENLDILERMGAELVRFSPVRDQKLPEGIAGIYLGGGYPEAYVAELAGNESMKTQIKEAARAGMPMIAECGGFMYTADNLIDLDGKAWPMLGLVDTDVRMTPRLSMEFGYVTLTGQEDQAMIKKGEKIRAHEFHYSRADRRGSSCMIEKYSGKKWEGIYAQGNILAGYPHFYFHNCPFVARRFMETAAGFRREK